MGYRTWTHTVAGNVTTIIFGNGYSDPNSNLNEAVCFSHGANNSGKSKNRTIFPPVNSETGFLTMVWQLVNEKVQPVLADQPKLKSIGTSLKPDTV